MSHKTEPVCLILASCLLFYGCISENQLTADNQQPVVENVTFSQESENVQISYDLISSGENQLFNVRLLLVVNEGESYSINPAALSGDVGEDVKPGRDKKITWHVLQDFPQGLRGEQIHFAVNVNQQIKRINSRWIYVTAGIVAIGAGISAVTLLSQSNEGSAALPLPPSRPGFK